jgi:hypothetical protein
MERQQVTGIRPSVPGWFKTHTPSGPASFVPSMQWRPVPPRSHHRDLVILTNASQDQLAFRHHTKREVPPPDARTRPAMT